MAPRRILTHCAPWVAVLLAVTACAQRRSVEQVDALVDQAVLAMQAYEAEGLDAEAALVAQVVATIDPYRLEIQPVLVNRPDELFDRGIAGANVSLRKRIHRGFWMRVLIYPYDRISDFFDTWSVDLHAGLGFYVDVHVTRAMTFAYGGRSVFGIGSHFDSNWGLQNQTQVTGFFLFGAETYAGTRIGTGGVRAGFWNIRGLAHPMQPLYQDFRDYFAVGAATTLVFFGVDADVHLFQVFDFVVGFVGFDPARDDLATTEALDIDPQEERLIQTLGQVATQSGLVDEYRAWLDARDDLELQGLGPGPVPAP